ncbi:Methyltransferase-like protein 13 [Chionoecetes opilio]|uniref:Methyltransferase-like protein 13 n=1 Tax=Chionoecetes opilio TaxID=41210 RepID=A0A8J4YKK5_CHIOP|nr:Methyltransferase-like protein 13 [Chionoecetes opilio]
MSVLQVLEVQLYEGFWGLGVQLYECVGCWRCSVWGAVDGDTPPSVACPQDCWRGKGAQQYAAQHTCIPILPLGAPATPHSRWRVGDQRRVYPASGAAPTKPRTWWIPKQFPPLSFLCLSCRWEGGDRRGGTTNPPHHSVSPLRREREWLFGSVQGREQLSESAGAARLLVAHLHRCDGPPRTLHQIQDELSPKVMELAPQRLPAHTKVPFLSVGEGMGQVQEVSRGHSGHSGTFVVEDIHPPDAPPIRRLVFLDNQGIVQSEARILPDHSSSSVGSINDSLPLSSNTDVSGGGGVGCGDGGMWHEVVGFCRMTAEGLKFGAILLDVDSKDTSVGMSCPPQAFVAPLFLQQVAGCLAEGDLKAVFPVHIQQDFPEEVNCVLLPEWVRGAAEALKGEFRAMFKYWARHFTRGIIDLEDLSDWSKKSPPNL